MPEYETLTADGTYASFKEIGDKVEGRIEAFSLDGDTDLDNNPVPQIVVGTTEGNVIVPCSNANLKRQVEQNAARIIVGHGICVTYSGEYPTKYANKGKEYTVAVTPQPVAPVVNTLKTVVDLDPF